MIDFMHAGDNLLELPWLLFDFAADEEACHGRCLKYKVAASSK